MKKLFLYLILFLMLFTKAFTYYYSDLLYTSLYYPQGAYFMLDSAGVLVGTNNFRFMGTILSTAKLFKNYNTTGNSEGDYTFTSVIPSVFVAGAYTNSDIWFGVAVGYQLDHRENGKNYGWTVHTPALAFSFLKDHALKLNFTTSVGYGYGALKNVDVISANAHARYNPNSEVFTQIRLYVYYGHLNVKNKTSADSLGFVVSSYFNAYNSDNFSVDPYFTIGFYTSLKDARSDIYSGLGGLISSYNITAKVDAPKDGSGVDFVSRVPDGFYSEHTYRLVVNPMRLGLTATSDYVTVYAEPVAQFDMLGGENMSFKGISLSTPLMQFYYGLYVELYITPIKDLTLYLEADMRGAQYSVLGFQQNAFYFDSCSGIQWFF